MLNQWWITVRPAIAPGSNSCDAMETGYALRRTAVHQVSGASFRVTGGYR
jgi:hypothetical protein